ncbi:MAG: S41 family peptidase, partial [Flavobacteriaceae bacterium]|nr:S41 family peptidase [Flavobacteriaceae bacterium]
MNRRKNKLVLLASAVLIFLSTTAYKTDYFEVAKQIEIYTTIFKEINMNYVDVTNPAKLMQTGLNSMLLGLDPYTTYLSEQDVETARMNQSESFVGVGAKVTRSQDRLIVTEVFEGLPANKKGVRVGDEIIKIDGYKVSGLKDVALRLLRGKKNSDVSLLILSNGVEKEISIKRAGMKPKAIPFVRLLDDGVGYIALDRFSKTSSKEVENALRLLIIDEAKGVILDLRNNPGGLLQEAIKIVNLFVPKGQLVVSTKSNIESYNQVFVTTKEPVSLEVPLVVLINERSASASEIVAGALQDLDRAVVLGKRSFGKGLVQKPIPLPYGGQLKVTISRYFTPSGRCIQAIDYAKRWENGVANKQQKKDYKAFKTKNGRTVFDGGGVSPDVATENKKSSDFIEGLVKSDLIFDFANNYSHNNSIDSVKDFKLSNEEFNAFKDLVYKSPFFLKDESILYLEEFSEV